MGSPCDGCGRCWGCGGWATIVGAAAGANGAGDRSGGVGSTWTAIVRRSATAGSRSSGGGRLGWLGRVRPAGVGGGWTGMPGAGAVRAAGTGMFLLVIRPTGVAEGRWVGMASAVGRLTWYSPRGALPSRSATTVRACGGAVGYGMNAGGRGGSP